MPLDQGDEKGTPKVGRGVKWAQALMAPGCPKPQGLAREEEAVWEGS